MYQPKYEDRLASWALFREELESSDDPFQHCIDKYSMAPTTSIVADPYDQKTWPGPWELIEWNTYCEFVSVLGMCYSLQLTERFSGANFEIHIGIDDADSCRRYICIVDDQYITNNDYGLKKDLPQSFVPEIKYNMTSKQ